MWLIEIHMFGLRFPARQNRYVISLWFRAIRIPFREIEEPYWENTFGPNYHLDSGTKIRCFRKDIREFELFGGTLVRPGRGHSEDMHETTRNLGNRILYIYGCMNGNGLESYQICFHINIYKYIYVYI